MDVSASPSESVQQRRRSQRVALSVPITVSCESEKGPLIEETRTLVVNVHGALINLAMPVSRGQKLQIRSKTSQEPQNCRVANVYAALDGKREVGIEFEQPAPRFWRVAFPPEDWAPAGEMPTAEPSIPPPVSPPPLAPAVAKDETPASPQREVTYAGFWRRFAGALIDGLLILTISWGAAALAARSSQPEKNHGILSESVDLVLAFMLTASLFYFIAMESSSWQATLGKRALRLYVTDRKGNRITLGRATGRTLTKGLTGLTLGIGFITAGFTQKKQALHDKCAGCLVLRRQNHIGS